MLIRQRMVEETLTLVTSHRCSTLPPWINSPTSYQLKTLGTLKRSYKKGRSSLFLFLSKLNARENYRRSDWRRQGVFWRKSLPKLSLQKYLKPLERNLAFPDEMYRERTEKRLKFTGEGRRRPWEWLTIQQFFCQRPQQKKTNQYNTESKQCQCSTTFI